VTDAITSEVPDLQNVPLDAIPRMLPGAVLARVRPSIPLPVPVAAFNSSI